MNNTPYFPTKEQNIELVNRIVKHLNDGGMVQLTTYLKSTVYDKRHADMFKSGSDGSPLVRHGKRWESFLGCGIRFSVIK